MTKAMMKLTSAVITTCLFASSIHAAPVLLSEAQLDSVAAGGMETELGFVCPVITTDGVLNSPKGGELGIEGYYTIGATFVNVPEIATNGDGEGSPPGPFSAPGDTDYTAIWYLGE